jgi:hypothetical protein
MKTSIVDAFIGPKASPSFSSRFRWQDSSRGVRIVFGGITIADSRSIMLLHKVGCLLVFYCFFNERMDGIDVDNELLAVPNKIIWLV